MKNGERENVLIFNGSIVYQNGRYALMVRTFIYDKENIAKIIEDILKKKEFTFTGKLIFRNPAFAVLRLKELNLI
ncbi:MAG: hypothetical protein QXJ14_02000 [Candidatus Aenigmatarchaeota archaeon]